MQIFISNHSLKHSLFFSGNGSLHLPILTVSLTCVILPLIFSKYMREILIRMLYCLWWEFIVFIFERNRHSLFDVNHFWILIVFSCPLLKRQKLHCCNMAKKRFAGCYIMLYQKSCRKTGNAVIVEYNNELYMSKTICVNWWDEGA